MPSSSLARDEGATVDVVLGDRFGTSCAPDLIDCAEAAFRGHGLRVVRNKPYAGGFITE
ncbi:N-formylglutamate amidohydrolase, partial [Methylobacterium aquaticum]